MATGTFYVRPSADISLGHPVVPDTLGAGYLAINEEVCDGTATYIGNSAVSADDDLSVTSSFKMSMNEQAAISRVISATFGIYLNLKTHTDVTNSASCTATVFVSNNNVFNYSKQAMTTSENGGGSFSGLDRQDMPNLVTAINSFINSNGIGSFPEITITVYNEVNGTNTKSTGSSYVSQIYIELECEYVSGTNTYKKVNGAWLQAQKVYQKRSGSWVEISEDEFKTILSGATIVTRGG